MLKLIRFSILLLVLHSCQSSGPDTLAEQEPSPVLARDSFPYALNQPNATLILSNKLVEISGLSLSKDEAHLMAVNDERGVIFYLNRETGEIEKELKFRKGGDYEGIEVVNDSIYVVKNTGTVYESIMTEHDSLKTAKYNTVLNSQNDVEGLGYDASKNRLLVACKGIGGKGIRFQGRRAVYGFDLETKELSEEPVFLIDRMEIADYLNKEGTAEKIIEIIAPDQSASAFGPSGIAIHPKTKEIYVLSSLGKILVVLNPEGAIKSIQELDSALYRQPEGICFDADGTLFISTEGRGGKAKIFRIEPI